MAPYGEALRRAGRWLGWLTVALSLGFVARQLWIATPWQLVAERSWPLTAAIVAGALAYGGASLLLSTAWRRLLTRGSPTWPPRCYHAVYGRTQIAKYLPGNVFHFAGRQILGRRLGHSQADLATASLLETGELVLVAALMALPLAWPWLGAPSWWWSLGGALAAAIIGLWWLGRQAVWRPGDLARLLQAALLYGAFFAISGIIAWGLVWSVHGGSDRPPDPITSVAAFTMAWVAGFVVPGAAAGIGIREAVLIMALGSGVGPEIGALVAVALRLVTVGGDGLFFLISITCPLPSERKQIQPEQSRPC